MNNNDELLNKTLDPLDWEKVKLETHEIVDQMFDHLKSLPESKIWRPIPDSVKQTYKESIPEEPSNLMDVFKEFQTNILPYNRNNIHPRYWGWVEGTGTVAGVVADFVSAVMNANVSFGEQAPVYIEQQIINWCVKIFNYPETADGILTAGGSVSNLLAIITARNAKVGFDVRKKGLAATNKKFAVYCSDETHNSFTKGVEISGLGHDSIRFIKTDNNFKIDLAELENAIQLDKNNGVVPLCVVGNLGTVNSGAIDPLNKLADIAECEKMWFHVDGAFGAWLKILDEYNEKTKGVERADSIMFDFHKWIYVPYDVSCVIMKNGKTLKDSFEIKANYLIKHERGLAAGEYTPSAKGHQLSRSFRALKIWFSLKEQGIKTYREMIRKNVEQAKYFSRKVSGEPQMELLAPVESNIVCFRLAPTGLSEDQLNILNKEIVMTVQEKGIATPSSTVLNGRYSIRIAITNQRTVKSDLDLFFDSVIKVGNQKQTELFKK